MSATVFRGEKLPEQRCCVCGERLVDESESVVYSPGAGGYFHVKCYLDVPFPGLEERQIPTPPKRRRDE